MKIKKQSLIESEIQLEVTKIAEKYSELGYNIYYNHRRKGYTFDLYAVNKESNQKIIFIFKHYKEYHYDSSFRIVEEIDNIKSKFPECKVIVVPIRKIKKFEFESGYLKEILFNKINENFQEDFFKRIKGFQALESITDLHLTSLKFTEKPIIFIKGIGNISFRNYIESPQINGIVINEGVPFNFEIRYISYSPFVDFYPLNTIISFDFSEFEDNNTFG